MTTGQQTRIMASQLQPGDTVKWQGDWLPALRVSRTSDGIRVVYDDRGWYCLIPPHKTVTVKI